MMLKNILAVLILCYGPVTFAGASSAIGIEGYINSLSETSVTIRGKTAVLMEVPKSEVLKTRPKFKVGEFIKLTLEKDLIKASHAKTLFSQK